MPRFVSISLLLLSAVTVSAGDDAPAGMPGTGLADALYELNQLDLHYHSGLERPLPMKEWLDLPAQAGRKVLVLIDHLELYRKSPEEYQQWLSKNPTFTARYPMGPEGHRALFADFSEAARRRDLLVFKGWEVYEGELDTGVDEAALRLADVAGWHISPNHAGTPPDGKLLIRRARQVVELQKRMPIPMILFHPFTMRVEHIERKANAANRPLESIPVAEYRFFSTAEQRELVEILRGSSVYVEIGLETGRCFERPNCRRAMLEDIRPLAAMGVQFTVSTDAHGIAQARKTFRPEAYAEALGVTPANTNTLVRELLARRAKAALAPTPAAAIP